MCDEFFVTDVIRKFFYFIRKLVFSFYFMRHPNKRKFFYFIRKLFYFIRKLSYFIRKLFYFIRKLFYFAFIFCDIFVEEPYFFRKFFYFDLILILCILVCYHGIKDHEHSMARANLNKVKKS